MIRPIIIPAAGNVAVIRDYVEEVISRVQRMDGSEGVIVRPEDERTQMQRINPWALVVGVGEPRPTQYGTTIPQPCRVGDRVLIAQVGKNIEIQAADGERQFLYVLPFEGVMAIMRYQCSTCSLQWDEEPEGRRCPQGCAEIIKPGIVLVPDSAPIIKGTKWKKITKPSGRIVRVPDL